jgi:tRNA pseudouridine38-40 synthase
LPKDISVKNIYAVDTNAHCRFDAISREYKYHICQHKNPFLYDRSHFFPYTLDMEKMQAAAALLMEYKDFTSFSKRNTQVNNFNCQLITSEWVYENDCWVYQVKGNRFLRGMVRALTATMLKVGRNKTSLQEFRNIIEAKDCTKADFTVPANGLFLIQVAYPEGLLINPV